MRAHLTRRYRFSASHRLHSQEMSEADNRAVYGKCNNPFGHGHNYTVEITVSGPVDEKTGMVCNLVDLDRFVHQQVIERYDHQNLNLMQEFTGNVPTTENLCIAISCLCQDPGIGAKVKMAFLQRGSMNIKSCLTRMVLCPYRMKKMLWTYVVRQFP